MTFWHLKSLLNSGSFRECAKIRMILFWTRISCDSRRKFGSQYTIYTPEGNIIILSQTNSKRSSLSDQCWPTSTLVTSRTSCNMCAGWPTLVASDQRPKVCLGLYAYFYIEPWPWRLLVTITMAAYAGTDGIISVTSKRNHVLYNLLKASHSKCCTGHWLWYYNECIMSTDW